LVGGDDKPHVPVPANQAIAFIAIGNMPVLLPNLSRIKVFRASLDFKSPPAPSQGGILSIVLQRRGLNNAKEETVVELGAGPGTTDSQNGPIPGKELVDNDLFKYSISSVLFGGR
jgi:hypothetical protein